MQEYEDANGSVLGLGSVPDRKLKKFKVEETSVSDREIQKYHKRETKAAPRLAKSIHQSMLRTSNREVRGGKLDPSNLRRSIHIHGIVKISPINSVPPRTDGVVTREWNRTIVLGLTQKPIVHIRPTINQSFSSRCFVVRSLL